MNKTLTRAGVAILVVLALAGCSSIKSGYITEKHHSDGYYYTTYICSAYNKDGLCMVQTPILNYQQPTWRFDLMDRKETGWVYVSENTYNQYEVGQLYQHPKGD